MLFKLILIEWIYFLCFDKVLKFFFEYKFYSFIVLLLFLFISSFFFFEIVKVFIGWELCFLINFLVFFGLFCIF